MGVFDFHQSTNSHRADLVFYSAAIAVLACSVCVSTPVRASAAAALWIALGWIAWSLSEYLLHRFALHRIALFRRLHDQHHRHPAAMMASPTLMSAGLLSILVFAPAYAMLSPYQAYALTLGMVSGYLVYTIVHYEVHQHRAKGAWLLRRKRWHALHHRTQMQTSCFGVTSSFWDHVFGTALKASGTQPH